MADPNVPLDPGPQPFSTHAGGKCPVAEDTLVDVQLADGSLWLQTRAGAWAWLDAATAPTAAHRVVAWRHAVPTWKLLGFESAEACRRSPLEGRDTLDASGELQAPPAPRTWTTETAPQPGRSPFGDAVWLVLMVLMLFIGFALGASFIAALRDGTASLISTFWGMK
jgi:hypothetical protein